MKKVLIFSTAYLPLIGGAEIAIKEITDRVSDFEFDMITARIDKKLSSFERVENINVYRIGSGRRLDKFLLPFSGLKLALKLNKKNKYSFCWSMMASQASVLASFFKNRTKTPLLLTIQEGDEEKHLKRYVLGIGFLYKIFIQPWHKLVFKKADLIQVISSDLKKRVLENKVQCDVVVIPNGVNVEVFSKKILDDEKNKIKAKLKIKKRDKIIITTSRFVSKNAVDDVIKSLEFLPKNIKFLIIGSGEDERKLKDLSKKLKVDDRVIFFGKCENQNLPKYLQISDVFVRPSLSEGQGISFLEAMVAGVPIIATPVGGIPDFLEDNRTGFFCKVRNPKSIAEKIEYILNEDNIEKIERVKNGARELIKNKYDWDDIAKKINNVFHEII